MRFLLLIISPRKRRYSRWKLSLELEYESKMILVSYSNSSIKGTEILFSTVFCIFIFYDRPFLYVCKLEENFLFSTLILGSVFNDYIVLSGDISLILL